MLSVGDGIARIYGLEKAMAGELLAFPNDVYGLALNLEEDQIGAVLMGESRLVDEGVEVAPHRARARRCRSATR